MKQLSVNGFLSGFLTPLPERGWHRSGDRVAEQWLTGLAVVVCKGEDPGEERVAACRYRKVEDGWEHARHPSQEVEGHWQLQHQLRKRLRDTEHPRARVTPRQDRRPDSVEESPLSHGWWNRV